MENKSKEKARNLKNITIVVCVAYLAVTYLLKQTIASYAVAIIALILAIVTLFYYRKAKQEYLKRQGTEIRVKPNFRKRNY